MLATQTAAQQIAGTMKDKCPTFAFDPATILIIIQALSALIPLIRDLCEKDDPAEAPALAAKALDDSMEGRRLFRICRRHVRRELGLVDYCAAGGDLMLTATLLKATERESQPLIQQMYEEVV